MPEIHQRLGHRLAAGRKDIAGEDHFGSGDARLQKRNTFRGVRRVIGPLSLGRGEVIIIVATGRGEGPDLHLHPYPEVFVVEAGVARFTVGGEEIVVEAGNVVVVPAETPHGFKGESEEKLRVVSFHPSPEVVQTDL